jgi:hypothetical protein
VGTVTTVPAFDFPRHEAAPSLHRPSTRCGGISATPTPLFPHKFVSATIPNLVLRASGSRLAGVTLEGNHRITMSATVYPNRGEPGYGEATLFRHRENDLTAEAVASAFGSAYVRATDPRYSDPNAVPLPTGPVEVGDFVKVRTVFGECRVWLSTR